MAAIFAGEKPEQQQGLLGTLDDSNNGSRNRGIGGRLAISCRRLVSRATFAVASGVGLVLSPMGGVIVLGTGAVLTSTIIGFKRKAAKEVMSAFDKLLKAFPDLNRPRIAALRDAAPDELVMRMLTIISRHQSQINPKDAPEGTMDKSSGDAGTADSDELPGPEASEETSKELRYWIHFAEAAYYEMATEDNLKEWLSSENCDLLYASSESSPNAPVYFVAVQPERKELIVSLRGTVSASDAVTDMIVTPQQWGDKDHVVHSGIGKSADTVYERLKHLAPAFAGSDHSIVLVGHSLGAGAAALLAWRLREQDGIQGVKVYAFACPPCSSPAMAKECTDYVTSCVFRDDLVPRLAPKAIKELEEELLGLGWEEMESCAKSWGPVGKMVYGRAKDAAETEKDKVDELEKKHKEDPLGHGDDDDGEEENGGGEENGEGGEEGQEEYNDVLMDPTVPGKIMHLHAMSEMAKRSKAAQVRENEGKGMAVPDDQRVGDFACVEVGSDHPCMTKFRLCDQSLDDHFLEQYRMGLCMRPRVAGGQDQDPAEGS